MRIRSHRRDVAPIDMTAMIDIVFQLMAFFVMTFKVTAMEADFKVRMPLSSEAATPIDELLPRVIQVDLSAGAERNIAAIDVLCDANTATFTGATMFDQLTAFVQQELSREGDAASATGVEVEFVIDPALRYYWTVQAMEAVSGKLQPDGSVQRLVEKIRFREPG